MELFLGAVRSALSGGQGNIQTYAGYTEGLNSAHIMFANDGLVADSSGSEPPCCTLPPWSDSDISHLGGRCHLLPMGAGGKEMAPGSTNFGGW